MLPISLSVTNFLSYRGAAPTLHLEDVHVACLCGPNGHGKSALFDAVTWALWGKTRRARQLEQLLHHGQDEMRVELVFDAAGERYRVTRRYSRARRTAQSTLELAVHAGDGAFAPITGDTIAATQAHLDRLVNMDYETFVNSAFLMQGRADLFTIAAPGHRKEVLAKVLGLGLYDRLEERAKQHAREVRGKLSVNALTIDRLRERAGRAEETRTALEEVGRSLAEAGAAVQGLTERLERLRERVAQLERRKAEGAALAAQIGRIRARRAEAQAEAGELERRIEEWRRAVERAGEIEAGFAALQAARERRRSLSAAAQTMVTLERELAPLKEAIAQARAGMESDIASQRRRIEKELTPRAQALPSIDRRMTEIAARAAEMEHESAEAANALAEGQRLTLEAQALRQENERLSERGKETRAKLMMLDHAHADGAVCPLCASELGPDGIDRVRASYRQELEQQRERYREQDDRAKALDRKAGETGRLAESAMRELDAERTRIGSERGRLSAQRDESERAAAQLGPAAAVLGETENALAAGSYAAAEQAEAHRLERRISELAYDAQAIGAAERQERELEHWEEERQALTSARARLEDDRSALERARQRSSEAGGELVRAEQESAAIEAELAELPSYMSQRGEVEREWGEAGARRDELQARRGSLLHQMEEVQAAASELAALEGERKAMTEEAGAYEELVLAFGKGGVQALLIEAAIPRLEDEANDLLKRMTEGRMSVKLETQRERKSGGRDAAVETLDISVADELGTRAYEMFSGGERFRVDFAMRIALSELLAWRAGAPLPTLFIDEGFGTQDAEGRDRIIDVIKAIEDRFERILVITHMDEIKEAFPVRIEVSRGAGGSTFALT